MTHELLALAIAIGAIILMVAFGWAVRRFAIKMPAAEETKGQRRRRALESIASRNWTLPPDYKFDRDEATGRSLRVGEIDFCA